MAKYFQVKYFDSDKEYGLLPNNSIKKEYLDKVNYEEKRPRFVGNFGWITPNKKLADGYLFNLSDYDKNYVKDVKLKPNEKIFRYFNERTAITGASLIVKLNLEKGLIYFLSEEGSQKDEPIFEGRGYPARWINIVKDKMADGGGVGFKPYGKTKGRYTIEYFVDDAPDEKQREIRETKEMAIDTARRYSRMSDMQDVKIFDENGAMVKYAKGGEVENNEMPSQIEGLDNIIYLKTNRTHKNPNGQVVTEYEGYWNGHLINGFWVYDITELKEYINNRIVSDFTKRRLYHLPKKELPKYAKGGTMKHTKDYYKNLPKHNGYEWYSFDKGKHWFKKKEAKGYSVIKVTDKDIEDGSFEFMAQHNMSRMAKGGGIYDKFKNYGSKGLGKVKDFTKKQIHDQKKKIALEVVDATKDKYSNSKQKLILKASEELIENKYAKGGKLSADDKSRYEELSKKVKEMLDGGSRLTGKELAEYSKLKHKKNMAESPLYRKQIEHEAKIEKRYQMAKGGLLGGFNYSIGGL